MKLRDISEVLNITHVMGSIEDEAAGPSYTIPAIATVMQSIGHTVSGYSIGPQMEETWRGFQHRKFPNQYQKLPILRALSASSLLQAALLQNKADIIHTHGLWLMPNIYAARVAQHHNIPLVVSAKGMLAPAALAFSPVKKAVFSALFQKKALDKVQLFHATSHQEYQDIRTYGLRQPVAIIPHGIDIPPVPDPSPRPRKQVLFLGRLHAIKGLSLLIAAWKQIEDNFPDWDLKIIGPGQADYIESLKGEIRQQGAKRIEIAPKVFGEDKLKAYQMADIYILPSQSENFAVTIAEALANGLPVICSKGTPWADVETQGCGWWIDGNPTALANCLTEALSLTNDTRQAMGQKGRAWMVQNFSWIHIAKKFETTYVWLREGGICPDWVKLD